MADAATLKRLDELAMRIERLDKKLLQVKDVLGRHISWLGQTANSGLSHVELKMLLEDLHK